jgi:hypothetical protein
VAERIDDLSVTSSPEHVLHRHVNPRTSSNGALDQAIRIVNQESDANAGSTQRIRRLAGSGDSGGT